MSLDPAASPGSCSFKIGNGNLVSSEEKNKTHKKKDLFVDNLEENINL